MYLYLSPGDFQYMNKSALKTRDDFILDWAFTIFHSSAIKAGINCPFTVTKKWGKNRVCKDINKSTLACRCRPSQPLDSSASLPDLTEICAAACSFLSILSCLIFCPLVPWPACLLAWCELLEPSTSYLCENAFNSFSQFRNILLNSAFATVFVSLHRKKRIRVD